MGLLDFSLKKKDELLKNMAADTNRKTESKNTEICREIYDGQLADHRPVPDDDTSAEKNKVIPDPEEKGSNHIVLTWNWGEREQKTVTSLFEAGFIHEKGNMTMEELEKRIADEKLYEYPSISVGMVRTMGDRDTLCIVKNENGTCSLYLMSEKGSELFSYENVPEEEACQFVYEVACNEKKFREWYVKKQSRNKTLSGE